MARPMTNDLCLRCTICCYYKILKDDGSVEYTDRPCEYLDCDTGLCIAYEFRTEAKADCVEISAEVIALGVLPIGCPYVGGRRGYRGPRLTPKLEKIAEKSFGHRPRAAGARKERKAP